MFRPCFSLRLPANLVPLFSDSGRDRRRQFLRSAKFTYRYDAWHWTRVRIAEGVSDLVDGTVSWVTNSSSHASSAARRLVGAAGPDPSPTRNGRLVPESV